MGKDLFISLKSKIDYDVQKLYNTHWRFFAQFEAEQVISEYDYSIVLMSNETNVDFITSTSPVMIRDDGNEYSMSSFYMPLSPKKGIIIVTDYSHENEDIIEDENTISYINNEMVKYAKAVESILISTNENQLVNIK